MLYYYFSFQYFVIFHVLEELDGWTVGWLTGVFSSSNGWIAFVPPKYNADAHRSVWYSLVAEKVYARGCRKNPKTLI